MVFLMVVAPLDVVLSASEADIFKKYNYILVYILHYKIIHRHIYYLATWLDIDEENVLCPADFKFSLVC